MLKIIWYQASCELKSNDIDVGGTAVEMSQMMYFRFPSGMKCEVS